jgi:hypothetical protein
MREEDLYSQVKVITAGLTFHWRSGDGNRLCKQEINGPVMTLQEAKQLNLTVCLRCDGIVQKMAKGWE